ncbi:hypothetical protein SDC9_189282 [bioreactor metagenome]|uniref:Methyltransferase type 11 domain-containing protein n=1 Tax=bioreactor metagenome TaxID=1076179 RepID=A0A645HS21_9ZZZZ
MVNKYELNVLKNNSTIQNYLENLYTIDLLDRYLPVEKAEELNVLDIGSKNWFYASAEYQFFKKYSEKLALDGIEIDSNRLYSNFYSRAEVAKFYTKNLDDANYIKGDFLQHNKEYDYLIWFLPFVFKRPHLLWGLPEKYFKPDKMLAHAFESLKFSEGKSGKIFIINQGNDEFLAQKKLCDDLNLPYNEIGEVKSPFMTYKHPRFLILVG